MSLLNRVQRLELALLHFVRAEFDFDPEKHPRGGNAENKGQFSPAEGEGDGSKEHPLKTDSVVEAAKLISEGKFVELPRDEVSVLLDKLAYYAQSAKDKGVDAPVYNLCNVSVEDTNLFCADSPGIPRIQMPQLAGIPTPGSDADKLDRNQYGWVDLTPGFKDHLKEEGHSFETVTVAANTLKATQNELNGAKVASIMDKIEAGQKTPGTVWVSSDNYILDGHHRWAAEVGEGFDSTDPNGLQMDVVRVDMPISVLLDDTRKYAAAEGLPQRGVGAQGMAVRTAEEFDFDPEKHPRGGDPENKGRFSPGEGGGSDVTQFIRDHPQLPGEAIFEWQSRIVKGLDPRTQNELIFATRERYEPVAYLERGIDNWNESHGLERLRDGVGEIPVNTDQAFETARYFETHPDDSANPEVQAAYDDFKRQNAEMYDYLTRPESAGGLGVKVDFVNVPSGNPYQSAGEQAADLRDNHHISIQTGLGNDHTATMTTPEYDIFRAVHDSFGHAGTGVGFDRHGEYQTWLAHSSMYTDPGRQAMDTEYHAVNSALWSGDTGTPGTGKSLLLPDDLVTLPAPITAAATPSLEVIIKALGLDAEWATRFSQMPWHTEPGAVVSAAQALELAGHDVSDQERVPSGSPEGGRFAKGGGDNGDGKDHHATTHGVSVHGGDKLLRPVGLDHKAVIDSLLRSPLGGTLDSIGTATGHTPEVVRSLLTGLEKRGLVEQSPGLANEPRWVATPTAVPPPEPIPAPEHDGEPEFKFPEIPKIDPGAAAVGGETRTVLNQFDRLSWLPASADESNIITLRLNRLEALLVALGRQELSA